MFPFGPFHRFQVAPASVTVAMGFPVEEMGPAPPKEPIQIMTSYSSLPVGVEDVKMSEETLATTLVPRRLEEDSGLVWEDEYSRSESSYVHFHVIGMLLMAATVLAVVTRTTLA